MHTVRGKFKVTKVTRNYYQPTAATVKLEAVYSNTPEDNSYSEATPTGSIEMNVSNAAAAEKLALGQSFYVDFTPVE